MAVPQKTSQVTNHEYVRMSSKQSSSPPCESLNPSQIQRKLLVKKSLRIKWSLISFEKLVMWRLFHLSINSEWYTTICLPKVFGGKKNKRRRIIVHHDNASPHTSAQTSTFLTGQNELMGQPRL